MAADILIQGAKKVPVGEDQLPHIEVAQKLAERFNKKYGDTFVIPEALQLKSVRVLSLKGEGKMSKSHPEGALFLGDSPEVIAKKIKSAETAIEGKMNEKIESHILIAKFLAKTEDEKKEIDALIKRHKQGEPIMGEFKKSLTKIVQNFTQEFQIKRAQIMQNPVYIQSILEKGRIFAKQNADETLFQPCALWGLNNKNSKSIFINTFHPFRPFHRPRHCGYCKCIFLLVFLLQRIRLSKA